MAGNDKTLTTAEFSQMTGIPVSRITQMLRSEKIRGEKRSGKWMIDESEVQNAAVVSKIDHGKPSEKPDTPGNTQSVAQKGYDVESFVQMTYLTEKGVRRWLKTGRLSGGIDTGGKILVDAANLDRPELSHLIRK